MRSRNLFGGARVLMGMRRVRVSLLGFAVGLTGWRGSALTQGLIAQPGLSAGAIMARVAANQDRAEAERGHYVYVQHARVSSHKGRKLMCEEITDSRVTPSGSGSHLQLLTLNGRVWQGHDYASYTTLEAGADGKGMVAEEDHELSIQIGGDDRDMVESLRADLLEDRANPSKDGINTRLFPLTSKAQGDYLFEMVGRARMNGRDVFHIRFTPKDKSEFDWKGDAYIDVGTYEPVVVSTGMSRNVPLAVRALLGTNVPGLGFSVTYAPQPDGVWFPVSFGTEFKIHVLFLFHREIVMAAQNRDFEKTHVSATIVGGDAAAPE